MGGVKSVLKQEQDIKISILKPWIQ